MRNLIWIPVALSVAFAGCVSVGGAVLTTSSKNYIGCVRHVVLFKFKDDATPDQVHAVENAFRELPHKIPGILDYEWGTNISPENLAAGYTHCFFLTFKDEAARDAYLPHPAHKDFGTLLHPYLDKVLVIDYKARE
jgi:quinol monooxygenase YgiN